MVRDEEDVVNEDIPIHKSKHGPPSKGQLSSYLLLSWCCCFCCENRWIIADLIMFDNGIESYKLNKCKKVFRHSWVNWPSYILVGDWICGRWNCYLFSLLGNNFQFWSFSFWILHKSSRYCTKTCQYSSGNQQWSWDLRR